MPRKHHREYYRLNATKMRLRQKLYLGKPAGRRARADTMRKANYGLSPEEYDSMVVESGGFCQLCLIQTDKTGNNELVVDHSHSDFRVRGLICNVCNKILGYIEGRGLGPEWIDRVWAYLK